MKLSRSKKYSIEVQQVGSEILLGIQQLTLGSEALYQNGEGKMNMIQLLGSFLIA